LAGKSADPHLQALEIVDALDLLAEPAAHLAPVLPPGGDDVVLLVEVVHQLDAAAVEHPGVRSCAALRPNGTAVPKAKVGSLPT
jgi:hypothetical protein